MSVLPRARQESLIVRDLTDEVVIYDLQSNQAHCLNQPAAIVWKNCDGRTTIASARRILERELNTSVSDEVVWLALDQLKRFDLLAEDVRRPLSAERVQRRAVLRNLGIAALAIPAIITLSAPNAQAQASCRPRGAACTLNTQCCSGNCRGNNLCA